MGGGNWSGDAYKTFTHKSGYDQKSQKQIFSQTRIMPEMNPKGLIVRESRDSENHPESIAIIVMLDETGSMGVVPEKIARHKLIPLMETLINNKVKDAHVLFGGVGDHYSDNSPIQVGQFEAEGELLNKWLTGVYLEANGGGQVRESYALAWLIAARHTSIDCFEKRNQKGFLFTIGDEAGHPVIEADALKELLGYSETEDVTDVQLLEEASKKYNVYHIHCQQGGYPNNDKVFAYWKKLLGERFYVLDDYDNIAEVIASTVAVQLGADLESVIGTMSNSTALAVKSTVGNVVKADNRKGSVVSL